jgi:hypothetical protein
MPAGADDAGPAAHPAQGRRGVQTQFPALGDEQVGDLVSLEVGPQIFDRVEFGSISRQFFQPESAATLREYRFDRLTAVDGRTIPDDQEFCPAGAGAARGVTRPLFSP